MIGWSKIQHHFICIAFSSIVRMTLYKKFRKGLIPVSFGMKCGTFLSDCLLTIARDTYSFPPKEKGAWKLRRGKKRWVKEGKRAWASERRNTIFAPFYCLFSIRGNRMMLKTRWVCPKCFLQKNNIKCCVYFYPFLNHDWVSNWDGWQK